MEIYTVKPGDSLYSIARRYGTTAERIASDNAIMNPAMISVGQALVILQPTETYTVQPGDTLWSISQQFGVSINQLWRNNPFLKGTTKISPGQVLFIALAAPELGRGLEVTGYVYPFIDREILRSTLPYLTYLSIFSHGMRPDGTLLQLRGDEELIALSREYGVAPIMMISSLGEDGSFSPELVVKILSNPDLQTTLIDDIERTVNEKGYAGVEYDLEYIDAAYADEYAALVSRTRERLNPQGYLVFADLAPKESAEKRGLLYEGHDYSALGKAADRLLLMTYEYGFTFSPPMAIAPVPQVKGVLDYAVTAVPSVKLLLGVPNYAYNWTLPHIPGTSKADSMKNLEAVNLAAQKKAMIQYDEYSQAPYYNYFDRTPQGPVEHEVWFGDPRSYDASFRLVNEYNLGGTGIWTIMGYYPQLWLVLNALYSIDKVLE